MNTTDTITERRTWFRFFPEGSLEFVVVTRVLILITLLSLAALDGARRDFALLGLAIFVWADYMLTVWWLIQVKTDLALISGQADPDIARLIPGRGRLLVMALIPATFLVMLVTPWSAALHLSTSAALITIRVILLVVIVGGIVLGCRVLRPLKLVSPIWLVLLMIPLLHWLASHRILGKLNRQLYDIQSQEEAAGDKEAPGGVALILADLTWFLSILPWVIFIVVMFRQGQWPGGPTAHLVPACGTCIAAIFAIIDIGVMESIQRQFVKLIRKAK